jgi:hypothetical protein
MRNCLAFSYVLRHDAGNARSSQSLRLRSHLMSPATCKSGACKASTVRSKPAVSLRLAFNQRAQYHIVVCRHGSDGHWRLAIAVACAAHPQPGPKTWSTRFCRYISSWPRETRRAEALLAVNHSFAFRTAGESRTATAGSGTGSRIDHRSSYRRCRPSRRGYPGSCG